MKTAATIARKCALIATVLALPALTGCAGHVFVNEADYLAAKNKKVSEYDERVANPLRESADAISAELRRMNAVQQANAEKLPKTAHKKVKSPDLNKPITLTWVGDIETATESLAELINWDFKTEGKAPLSKPLVRIDVLREPAIDVLRDIGLQAGRDIGLTVDPTKKLLMLTYVGESNEK